MADQTEFLSTSSFWFDCPMLDGKRAISEISGLTIKVKADAGLNTVAVGPKGASVRQGKPVGPAEYENIKIKVIATKQTDLYKWFTDNNPADQGQASKWKSQGTTATVKTYAADGSEAAIWEIKSCYPTSYGGPDFKAGEGGLANESFELVHDGFKRTQ